MTKMIIEQTVVMTFVITNGTLPQSRPFTTKNKEPRPSIENVIIEMPSVLRVLIVVSACGKYPSTMQILARYPKMSVMSILIFLVKNIASCRPEGPGREAKLSLFRLISY